MKPYITVKAFASEEYETKKSRFIGYAAPVENEAEAVSFIDSIRQKHRDATHNVYAYSLRTGQLKRYSDDGEPQGTAGLPVLDVLLKGEITDCAVVVTRYFGGTLLGTGGLVRAYSHTASIAVQSAQISTKRPWKLLSLECDYSFYGKISSLVPEHGGNVISSDFGGAVELTFRIPEENTAAFNAALTEASNGRLICGVLGDEFDF